MKTLNTVEVGYLLSKYEENKDNYLLSLSYLAPVILEYQSGNVHKDFKETIINFLSEVKEKINLHGVTKDLIIKMSDLVKNKLNKVVVMASVTLNSVVYYTIPA